MLKCYSCGTKFKQSEYNTSGKCNDCYDDDFLYLDDDKIDVDLLVNPTGKTKAVFYDDYPDEDQD